jgi:hypothetical protein
VGLNISLHVISVYSDLKPSHRPFINTSILIRSRISTRSQKPSSFKLPSYPYLLEPWHDRIYADSHECGVHHECDGLQISELVLSWTEMNVDSLCVCDIMVVSEVLVPDPFSSDIGFPPTAFVSLPKHSSTVLTPAPITKPETQHASYSFSSSPISSI